jgi:hypothetical protein
MPKKSRMQIKIEEEIARQELEIEDLYRKRTLLDMQAAAADTALNSLRRLLAGEGGGNGD